MEPDVVGSIVEVSALTCCVLLHSVCDVKSAQMNVQRCPNRELMPYDIELGHHAAAEATKTICCTKGEGAIDPITITRWLKKFRPSFKNLDDQAR